MRLHSIHRRLDTWISHRILSIGLIEVALNHPLVPFTGLAIHPKTHAPVGGIQIPYGGVPIRKFVEVVFAGRAVRRIPVVELAPNPVGDMVIGNCAPSGFHSAGFVAGGRGDLTTLCLLRLLGDDVDHSVYGIGSPHHSPRTPYHFDLLYVAHGDIDRVPDDAGKQRRPARASPTTNGSNCANERDARGEAGEAARLRETAAPRAQWRRRSDLRFSGSTPPVRRSPGAAGSTGPIAPARGRCWRRYRGRSRRRKSSAWSSAMRARTRSFAIKPGWRC